MVEFEKVTEARGRNNYMKQTGINFSFMDYADGPEIKITPINTTGRSEAAVMHIPLEEVEKTVVAIIETARIDIVEFAKKALVSNGYVDFFVSSDEIRMIATEEQRELTDEELASVMETLSRNRLEGICEEAVRGAISEVCAEATDQEWEGGGEEDDSGIEYLRSIGKK